MLQKAQNICEEATNDVAFTKDGIKHKLTASGKIRNGIETTNYWNSKEKVTLETNVPASLDPIEKLTSLKEYVNSQTAHVGRRDRI